MVFGFDPRKLVKDQQEEEAKKVKEVISAQEAYDLVLEEAEAASRKKSTIKESLSMADKAIREVKYTEKHGFKAWGEAKKKEDPEAWKKWNEWQDNTFFGKMFKTDKSKTLEEEYIVIISVFSKIVTVFVVSQPLESTIVTV